MNSYVFYKPDRGTRYEHINGLFSESINWELIEIHLPDMLRIALSIR
ncbi:transposase, partial [Massilia mucilaginosa]